MRTEDNHCPVCREPQGVRKSYWFKKHGMSYLECAGCGTWRLQPRLREQAMIEHYKHESYFEGGGQHGYDDYDEQEPTLIRTFNVLFAHLKHKYPDLFRPKTEKPGLLEIGCGTGTMLQAARQSGFGFLAGTDFNEAALQKSAGFADETITGGLDDIPQDFVQQHNIQVIAASNVIEHVYDPVGFIRRCRDLLPENGVLLLTTPDAGSLWRRFMRKKWPSFIIPEHVFCFTEKGLKRCMGQAGLTQTASLKHPHYYPLSTVMRKLGMPDAVAGRFRERSVAFNGVMLAVSARK